MNPSKALPIQRESTAVSNLSLPTLPFANSNQFQKLSSSRSLPFGTDNEGKWVTSGNYDTAIGRPALNSNTTGFFNTTSGAGEARRQYGRPKQSHWHRSAVLGSQTPQGRSQAQKIWSMSRARRKPRWKLEKPDVTLNQLATHKSSGGPPQEPPRATSEPLLISSTCTHSRTLPLMSQSPRPLGFLPPTG